MSCSSDWANGKGHQRGGVNTSLEVVSGLPVSFGEGSVGLDGLLVQQPALGNVGGQLGGVGEDLAPSLDGSDIIIHTLAGVESLRELEEGERELKAALGDVVPAALLEVSDGLLNFAVHLLGSLPAGFDFGEVVVTGHAVDKASNEVRDSHSADANGSGNDDFEW